VIPNETQFKGYVPGVIPKPVKLPKYIAETNPWLQKMIELEIHQLAEAKRLKGMSYSETPT
jgi:hypothetical protein